MASAARLRQAGFDVEILERASQVGGLVANSKIGGFSWDSFYHVILLSDTHLLGLLEDLNLASRITWSTTRTGFFGGENLYSLSTSIDFLQFPLLSLTEKTRLAWTILEASRIENGAQLEAIPISDWLVRKSGRAVFERIWRPLLRSKLGDEYHVASAAFIWAIIRRMYAARRTGLKREMFGYVEGGYRTVLDRLQESLIAQGISIRCGVEVKQITTQKDGGVVVSTSDGGSLQFDSVVLTLPSPAIARLLPQLAPAILDRLQGVRYQGIICASVLLRRPLASYYVTNILDDWVPFTGVIEMTALVDSENFGGNSLVYLPRYLSPDDSYWSREDSEIQSEFIEALERMYPDFEAEDVLDFQVSRARHVLAVSTLDYSQRWMPEIRTGLGGIYVLNSAQIANGTLNVNETLGVLETRFPELLSYLSQENSPPHSHTD